MFPEHHPMLSQQRKAHLRPVVPEAASAGPVQANMPHVSRSLDLKPLNIVCHQGRWQHNMVLSWCW